MVGGFWCGGREAGYVCEDFLGWAVMIRGEMRKKSMITGKNLRKGKFRQKGKEFRYIKKWSKLVLGGFGGFKVVKLGFSLDRENTVV